MQDDEDDEKTDGELGAELVSEEADGDDEDTRSPRFPRLRRVTMTIARCRASTTVERRIRAATSTTAKGGRRTNLHASG